MLSVSPPPGLSASFSGRNSWYMASASATVTVQAEAAVAPGTYYVMITGNVSAHEPTNSYTWHTMLPVVVSAAPALRR